MAAIVEDRLSYVRELDDVFAWGYPLFALCCEITLATLQYFDRIGGTLNFVIYLSILVAAITLVVAIMGIAALLSGKLKRAVALLFAPSILALQFIFPLGALEDRALDLLRFYLTKGHYDAVVEKLPSADGASKVAFFDWGATDLLEAPSYYWLVYDESGEITLPVEERSRAWRVRVPLEHRLADDHCLTSTHHLSGHYYSMIKHCVATD